jgi:hypothetical protein
MLYVDVSPLWPWWNNACLRQHMVAEISAATIHASALIGKAATARAAGCS